MHKNHLIKLTTLLAMLVLPVLTFSQSDTTARIWVSRSIDTDTIYYEGAPNNTRATVSLKAWASGDSIFTGQPIDVAIVTDNSTSMQEPTNRPRNPGDRNWLTPNRIQGTYNASVNFVDSFMNTNDRVAHLRFGGFVVTPQTFTDNFNAAKSRMDTTINGRGSLVNNRWTADGTAVWDGILAGIRYVLANKRPNITSVIIALTDGEDNRSRTTPNNIIRVLDSIELILGTSAIKVFTINLGTNSNSAPMRNIAAAGNGSWAYSATGTDLDAIFQGIGQRLTDVVGRSIAPGAPVLVDVLGPGIHYVSGSFTYRSGIGFVIPSFLIDTINGFTRLSFGADSIRLEQFLDLQYQITASMSKPDIFKDSLMRTNNTLGDTAQYSFLRYKDIKDTVVTRPIERNWVNVRSGIGGLFLSESLSAIVPPSATKLIPLVYSYSTPATYPTTTMYSLLQQLATNTVKLTTVNSQWFFLPNAGWTAPMFTGISASARDVGITVPYNYVDQDSLTIRFNHRNTTLRDYLIFSASDSSSPEQLASIVLDNDTLIPGFIDPPRIVLTGNRTQLNAISMPLFSRAITNRNNNLPDSSIWSIEQFTLAGGYLSPIFQGINTQKTLSPNLPVANFSQTDSGLIRITSGALTFALNLVIKDTTNYDTTDVVAIYDSTYGNYSPYIEAAYSLQSSRTSINATLGDSITLYALRFDSNGTAMRYLGSSAATWQINGGTPIVASQLVFTSQTALQTDQITVTYVNEWGRTLTSTFTINWGFGRTHRLSVESQPGIIGSAASSPLDSITIQANATDTIRGIYAVIRDEYGYCVDAGTLSNSAIWGFSNPSALAYLSIPGPSDSLSSCWIHKTSSPASPISYYLVANGLQSAGVGDQKDSIKVKLANYNYSRIEIVAAEYFQGFAPGDVIPRNTIIRTGCDRAVRLYSQTYYNDTLFDIKPVLWTNSAIAMETEFYGVYYSITPLSYSQQDTIVAHYVSNDGVNMFDTLLFSVDSPLTASVRIDTSRGVASGLQTLEIVGNLLQIRSKILKFFSFASTICPAMPEVRSFGTWSSSITESWILPFINQSTKCSLTVPLSVIPVSNGDHSVSGTILFRDGNNTAQINLIIRDTTDYDTLECLIPDTTNFPSVQTFQDYLHNNVKTEYTMRAGDTLKLRSRFYDINATTIQGVLAPKYVGTDTVRWEMRTGNAAPIVSTGASYRLSQTLAGRTDTIIVTYPVALRAHFPAVEYPIGATELKHTIIVRWIVAAAHEIKLSVSDFPNPSPITTDTVLLTDAEDTLRLYAIVYDRFGNIVSSADKMTWFTDSTNWISVPSTATHNGVIVKKDDPDFLATFFVEATLPGNSYLGSGIYSPATDLKTSIYIQTGNFTTNLFRVVLASSVPFQTTSSKTIIPGDTILAGDTLLIRICDESLSLKAFTHSTNLAVGSNGWSAQSVLWTDSISSGIRNTYTYSPDNSRKLFSVRADYLAFSQNIYFRILPEYGRTLKFDPVTTDKRILVEGDTTRIRQATASLYSKLITNCGRSVDTIITWSSYGFSNPVWHLEMGEQLGTAQTTSKLLNFSKIVRDTVPQSDSGYIVITFVDSSFPIPNTLSDTIKLVIKDKTDYDTVDVMALVPYSVYRQTIDKDGLYNSYSNRSTQTIPLGDTLRITPLLFDINIDGYKYLGNGRVAGRDYRTNWFLNGVEKYFLPDSLFTLTTRSLSRDTIVAVTFGRGGLFIATDTLVVIWEPGRGRRLHLENQPGIINTAASPVDTLVLIGSLQRDTVYGVIRDEHGSFVSNASVTRWSMTPVSYYNYLQIPASNLPTNEGTLNKLSSPSTPLIFAFIGSVERNTEISGVTTGAIIRDTAYVRLVNYDYTAVDIVAATSNITDTTGTPFTVGQTMPKNRIIELTALEDSISVRSILLRDDTAAWESQSVSWKVSGNALYDNNPPVSSTALLKPRRVSSLDTIFASRINGSLDTLKDTMLFRVLPPYIDTFIIIYNPNPIAGDTISITIIAIDKEGDTIKDPSRLPDTFSIVNPGMGVIIDTGTPFPGGTVITIVPIITGTDTMIISIPIPRPDGSIDTLRDTIIMHTTPSLPNSIAIIKTGGKDTLVTAGEDLSLTSATIEVRIYDQYGNLIPTNNSIYDSIRVKIGGVMDSTDTIRTNRNSYTVNVQNNTQSGSGFISVEIPGRGNSFKDTLTIFVSSAVRVVYVATHEWVPDTSNVSTVRFVISNILNIEPDTISFDQSKNLSMLRTLSKGGFNHVRDGFLDYLTIKFSEPVDMQTDFIKEISFKAGTNPYVAEASWRLDDSASGRTIFLEPMDRPVAGKNALWRLWLITNADCSANAALETGYLPSITFNNTSAPVNIGSGDNTYTVPMESVKDSAAPVISRVLFRNNACDLTNPNNALVITFSEPVKTSAIPALSAVTALSLNDGSSDDSLFIRELALSGGRLDFVDDNRLAWNYHDNPDRMMSWQLLVDRNKDARLRVGRAKIRFSLAPSNKQILDMNNNSACKLLARSVTLTGDIANTSYLCNVSGLNNVDRNDARFFSWSYNSDNGQQYPMFPYFGFSVNLDLIVSKSPLQQVSGVISVGEKKYVIMDFDTSFTIVNSEVKIFDLIGNRVADPTSNNNLQNKYTVGTVRRYLEMADYNSGTTLTQAQIDQNFDKIPASQAWDPDTLIPRYPATLPLDFEFMSKNCGTGTNLAPCVPAWNCYNYKGRLVSPGGYIAIQTIATPAGRQEMIRRLIVRGGGSTSGIR
jgi:hypothetical protein